jgi:hypothetical protein
MRIDQTSSCTVWPTYGFIFALCLCVVFCRNGRFSHLSIASWFPYLFEFDVRVDSAVVNAFIPVSHGILCSLLLLLLCKWTGIPQSAWWLRYGLEECGIVFDSREGQDFFCKRPDRARGDPGPVQWVPWALSPEVKRPVHEGDESPLFPRLRIN